MSDKNNDIIAFNRPFRTDAELDNMREALVSGHVSGDGKFTQRCHQFLETALGVRKVLLTTSCTHALEMAAMLLDFKEGDEVIFPSFTFVSTVNAFVLQGARPVFADIRMDTLNLDENHVARLITPRTRAVVPVHYAGVGCNMNELSAIAAHSGLRVIEDNAHGLFGKYNNQYLGTFGCMATQSFHETKNFTSGEGGALLINDESFLERAEIIREKGTNRSRFFRGMVDKYSWVDLGSSYLPSDILAAYLLAQLEARAIIQYERLKIWHFYNDNLKAWAHQHGVRLPIVPLNCDQSYHMFYMLMPNFQKRQAFIAHLRARDIMAVFHYLPLHISEMGIKFGGKTGQCPVTESISDRIVRLPFFVGLNAASQNKVIEAVLEFG